VGVIAVQAVGIGFNSKHLRHYSANILIVDMI